MSERYAWQQRSRDQRADRLGQQVQAAGAHLDETFHQEIGLAANQAALGLIQIGPNDHVGQAGLVLYQQEDDSLRRSWPLAAHDHARGLGIDSIAGLAQLFRGEHVCGDFGPEQADWMVAGRKVQQAIIGHHTFPFLHVAQGDHVLVVWERQWQLRPALAGANAGRQR